MLLLISFILASHFSKLALTSDRDALLRIKLEIIRDPEGVFNSWNDSLPVCKWEGITCGRLHQRVTVLNLASKGLVGTLSPAVGNLSFLGLLDMSDNTLHGHIPPQVGNLLRLQSLILSNNSFEGEIPTNISRCLNLKVLVMSRNFLRGRIPAELATMPDLQVLDLGTNKLTGNFNIVTNMTSLQMLSLGFNQFDGSIPYGIGDLKGLTLLAFGENNIYGMLPLSLYNLSTLEVLDLGGNQLGGSPPIDFGFHFPKLTRFGAKDNLFRGHVPASLSNLSMLEYLDISSNNFTGQIAFSAKNVPSLYWFDISDNYLGTGEEGDLSFIDTLVNCSQLFLLEAQNNNFGGVLPYSLGNLSTALSILNLFGNSISGGLPPGLFNLVNIQRLALRENQLTGSIPADIGKLTSLESLSLESNKLSGKIPASLGNLSQLETLYLHDNKFEGTVPSSLGNCTSLLYLRLSQNNLNGSLPPQLFHVSTLVMLGLDQNHLHGTLPMEVSQLKVMVLLNISENDLNGEIPSSLASCISLTELDMGGNDFTGSIPQFLKHLTSLQHLNLSHNRFSGQIPSFLSEFPLEDIDLSFNNFDGQVPSRGIFRNISAVSLIGNDKLCGGMPELHLPKCSARRFKRRRLSRTAVIVISIACLVSAAAIVSLIFLLCLKRKEDKLSSISSLTEPILKVSYDMLLKATDGFSPVNVLGSGGFGSVYKGILGPDNTVVAVKVISLEQQGANKSFMAECKALRNVRHRNLVKIITACSSIDFQGNDFKALVYEFMSNGNLDSGIHVHALTLLQRVNIAIEVACALDYLHNGGDIPIVHCDLKPSNILLDNEMVAHVGDFGLARFRPHTSTTASSSAGVKGTIGYAAPEYGLGSMVSQEGDVYSYGIVLLEMVTSKRPTDIMFDGGLNLHKYAKSALPNRLVEIIDPRLLEEDDEGERDNDQMQYVAGKARKIESMKSLVEVGLKCSVESPQDRMSIADAIRELQSTRDVLLKT